VRLMDEVRNRTGLSSLTIILLATGGDLGVKNLKKVKGINTKYVQTGTIPQFVVDYCRERLK